MLNKRFLIYVPIFLLLVLILVTLSIILPWLFEDFQDSKNMRKLKNAVEKSENVKTYKISTDQGASKIYYAEIWTKTGIYADFSPLSLNVDPMIDLSIDQLGEFQLSCVDAYPDLSELTGVPSIQGKIDFDAAFEMLDEVYEIFLSEEIDATRKAIGSNCKIYNVGVEKIPKAPVNSIFSYRH